MRRWALGLAALVALSACTADAAGGDGDGAAGPTTVADYTVLEPCAEQPDRPAAGAATLPAVAFDCLGGGTLDLGQAPGVPTLVNLWGSWCGPCRKELPLLQELSAEAGDRLQVVGVISKDGLPQAASFAEEAGVTFAGAYDGEGELMAELGLKGLPFTYFLDADGALVHTQVGEVTSAEELRGLVAEHLGVQL
jgi:thiol-disulfide isomerase/thioredoxin